VFAPSPIASSLAGWRPSPSAAAAAVGAKLAGLAVFAVAGMMFFGLAIASPVVLPIAERGAATVSAADVATAHHIGSAWWLFAIGAVVSFVAAAMTIGRLLEHLGSESEG
jgi:hypothetical protein